MSSYNIAVIRGDGIGIEVIEEGIKVLNAVGAEYGVEWQWVEHPWGSGYYIQHGLVMPPDALDTLQESDAIFLGAVGHPDIQDHITLGGLLLPIRRSFDQYVCERPSILYKGIDCPIKGYEAGDIDILVIRENTEGEYADVGGFVYPDTPNELGVQVSRLHPQGLRAHHPLRIRGRPSQRRRQARYLYHQIKRPRLRYDRMGQGFRERRGGVPRHRDRLTADRRRLHGLHQASGLFRRGGRQQPVRRHPDRHRRYRHRQHGTRDPVATSTPTAATRPCSSLSTAPRPTSWARASPIRSRLSSQAR